MILHQLPGRPATPELVLPSQVYAWYRLLRSVSPTSQPPASPLLGHAKPLLAGTEDPPVTDAVRGVGRGAVTALTFCWPPKGHKPNQATLVTLLIKFLSPWGCQKNTRCFPPVMERETTDQKSHGMMLAQEEEKDSCSFWTLTRDDLPLCCSPRCSHPASAKDQGVFFLLWSYPLTVKEVNRSRHRG